jgi:hypothetical protein
MNKPFSNIDIVTIAVYLLGGDSKYIDTEDVAVKANQLAPGRFTWRKYHDQINIDNVRKRLSDAKNPAKGGYLLGSFTQGWLLSENGLKFCRKHSKELKGASLSRAPLDKKEMSWRRHEKARMLASPAFEKIRGNKENEITSREAEGFFMVDDYITGVAREKKLARIINTFGNDSELDRAIRLLKEKVRDK